MDGLSSGVFSTILPIKLHGTMAIAVHYKQCKRQQFIMQCNMWLADGGLIMHHNFHLVDCSFVMLLSMWLAASSHAHALWPNDRVVNHHNMVFLSIFQGQLSMFSAENSTSKGNVNVIKSVSINEKGLYIVMQVRFFSINALYFFVKPQSPKLHFC